MDAELGAVECLPCEAGQSDHDSTTYGLPPSAPENPEVPTKYSVGGAICIAQGSLHIGRSTFTSNVAVFGWSIFAGRQEIHLDTDEDSETADATLDLRSCSFTANDSYLKAEYLDDWERLYEFSRHYTGYAKEDIVLSSGARGAIVNTTFTPFSVSSVRISYPSGCQQHPCGVGEACVYENSSIFCLPCTGYTVGSDGRLCTPCPKSTGPNADRSECVSCPLGQASPRGVCAPCGGDTIPNAAATACVKCPANKTAVDGACVLLHVATPAATAKTEAIACSSGSSDISTVTLVVSSVAALLAGVVLTTVAVRAKPDFFDLEVDLGHTVALARSGGKGAIQAGSCEMGAGKKTANPLLDDAYDDEVEQPRL
eukprot:COSAG02_NODE_1080_length_14710_cov_46.078913_5_plen_370_part_00